MKWWIRHWATDKLHCPTEHCVPLSYSKIETKQANCLGWLFNRDAFAKNEDVWIPLWMSELILGNFSSHRIRNCQIRYSPIMSTNKKNDSSRWVSYPCYCSLLSMVALSLFFLQTKTALAYFVTIKNLASTVVLFISISCEKQLTTCV